MQFSDLFMISPTAIFTILAFNKSTYKKVFYWNFYRVQKGSKNGISNHSTPQAMQESFFT